MKNQKTNTHWHFRNIFLLLVILLCGTRTTLHSQNYPVQLTTQLIPPFSGYLPDYAAPDNSKLRLLVLFTDFSQPSYNIKFKFKLEGQGITIQSQSWYYDGPFTVEPGVPQMLSGDDLSGLLDENHLDFSGITRQLYDQRKVLPEGFYTITVTAYDFANPIPIQVSNEAVVQAWMVLNDPPMLNLPACSSTIQPIDPQQITFSWTPMNLAAPSSALGTEYTFDLWEIFPADANAGNIIASTAPLYSTVTSFPFVNYGIAEPPLIVGREYVWRVRAHDLENRELFRNNGYSQQCTFSWGNSNLLLGNIAAIEISSQVITHRQALCSWDSINVFSSYHLEFRKVNGNWFPVNTNKASLRIADLEPNCNYEARVQGVFPDGNFGNWSNITSWHTPTQPQFSCGEQSPPPAMQNFHPLTQANTGMIWQAGQFEMQVLALSNTSSGGGWYTGTGKIILPFGITVGCSFNGIQIGTDMVMYAGEIKAMTDGVGNWLSQYNSLGFVQPDISYSGEINSTNDIQVNELEGTITIGGQTFYYEQGEGTAIEDADGTLYIVTADGTVVYAGQTGIEFNPPPPSVINTSFGKAEFSAANNQLYGFDSWEIPAWKNYYGTVTDIKDSSEVVVSWKSVQKGKYDIIKIQLSNLGNLSPDSIFFYCPSGTIYASHGSGLNRTVYLVGGDHKDVQQIYAGFYNANHQIVNIGKVNVISYREETKELSLINFSGQSGNTSISNSVCQSTKTYLDSIYKGAVVKWNVSSPSQPFSVSGWDVNADSKLDAHSDGIGRYSDEMNTIISAAQYSPWYNHGNYYLFISAVPPDSAWPNLNGEMPRNRDFGFVFLQPGNAQFNRTVAHEIGHGAFALEHSFEGNAPAPQGTTTDLMDYSSGNTLAQWQWQWIHNPAGFTAGDEDDDAASVYVDMRELLPFLNPDSVSFTFVSPAGLPISIPKKGLTSVVFGYGDDDYDTKNCIYHSLPVGTLKRFTLNSINYVPYVYCATNTFAYYGIRSKDSAFVDTISSKIHPTGGIIGYPCIDGGGIIFVVRYYGFEHTISIPSSNYLAGGPVVDHIFQPTNVFQPNATYTQIDAVINPPYSSDAISYLNDHIDASGCGSTRSSYVITYAYQINTYPDVYEACFKEQPVTPSSFMPLPNAYLSVPISTPMEQAEQQIAQLKIDTKEKFFYTDRKRRNVNDELMGIQTPSVMADSLRKIELSCIWNVLHASTRIHAIKTLCQSSVQGDWLGMGNNYESLVLSLLGFTNDYSQQDSILNALRENNNELLKSLWSKLDMQALDEFANTITGWIVSKATDRPSFSELHNQSFISSSNSNNNTPLTYLEIYKYAGTNNVSHNYIFTCSSDFALGTGVTIETFFDPDKGNPPGGLPATVNADAFTGWVAVKIMNDIPALGLKENQSLVVPGIWVKWLTHRLETEDVSEALNLIGQIVLMLATDGLANALFDGAFIAVNSAAALEARIIGQDLRAVVVDGAEEATITLKMERAIDGSFTWKGVKWEQNYNPQAITIGRLPNCKFAEPSGQIVTRELLVVKVGEVICVRDATAVALKIAQYERAYISTLTGFSDNIEVYCAQEGISLTQFKILEEKTFAAMSTQEQITITNIRNRIATPSSNTLMQKVIPKSDIAKYVSGEYTSCRGFMTTVADSKHLITYDDFYYGMRLDYAIDNAGTQAFYLSDGSCGVIRFKAANINEAVVPINTSNPAPFPFTNNGFTSGTAGRLGVPELKMNNFVELENGAELWEITSNGAETLKAVYNSRLNKFIPIP